MTCMAPTGYDQNCRFAVRFALSADPNQGTRSHGRGRRHRDAGHHDAGALHGQRSPRLQRRTLPDDRSTSVRSAASASRRSWRTSRARREPPRAYSMSSSPHERYLAVTVKEERYVSGTTRFPPLLSPLLVKRTVRGMRLVVTGFTGPYTLGADVASEDGSRRPHLRRLGQRAELFDAEVRACEPCRRCGTRSSTRTRRGTTSSTATRWSQLAAQHPDRLAVVHTLTREENPAVFGPSVRRGRVSGALLREVMPDPSARTRVRLRSRHLEVGCRRSEEGRNDAAAEISGERSSPN